MRKMIFDRAGTLSERLFVYTQIPGLARNTIKERK